MKILHIIDTLWLGGAQNLLKSIFERSGNDREIFLYSLRTREFNIWINHPNVIANPSVSKYSLRPLKKLKRIISENHIEVLHCHLPRSQVFGYILKRLYFHDIKLVFHEHGEVFEKYLTYHPILKIILKKTDAVICVSEESKTEIDRILKQPPVKTAVLHNFINTKTFSNKNLPESRENERQKMGISPSDFLVGFAGRLFERKGWKVFIDAALLLKSEPGLKFIMAGTGEDKDKLIRNIKEKCLQDTVLFRGYFRDMLSFYTLIDCFVLPSHWEGMPLAGFEARACGLPVIISNGTGMQEFAENTLFFENKNPADLAAKISLLKNNLDLRLKLSELPQLNTEPYSFEIYMKKLTEIYIDLNYRIKF